jgi:uncharacterized protein with HEPN domain
MQRDIKLFLEDIISAIEKIESYTKGNTFEKFRQQGMLIDAILYNLEVIGEAAKHIPDDMRLRYPEVEWRKVIGLRDIVAHEYFGISLEIVWDVTQNKLPDLYGWVIKILELER